MRKFLFLAFMLLISTPCFAANKWLHASAGTGEFLDDTGSWRSSDQGATVVSHPVDGDIAYMTVNAGTRTLTITGSCAASSINATGGLGTITGTGDLQIKAGMILGAGVTWSHTGKVTIGTANSAATLTLNGNRTFGGDFTVTGSGAKAITGGILTVASYTQTGTCNFTTSDASSIVVAGAYSSVGYYINDAATNPKYYLQGTIAGYLPNSTTGCYFDGANTLEAGTDTYHTQVREGTYLQEGPNFVSVTTTDNWTYFVSFSGKIDTPNVQWNVVQPVSGTYTLESDFKVNHWQGISANGTINGAGFKVKISGSFVAYGATDWDGDFDGFEMVGTGNFATPVAVTTGQSNDSTVLINANVIFNPGAGNTITVRPKLITFGGGKKMTHLSGTVVTTGCSWAVSTGGYTFDIDTSIPTLDIITAGAAGQLDSDFSADTVKQIAGSYLKVRAGKELTIPTAYLVNGTSDAQAYVRSAQVLTDFVGTRHATMVDSSYAVSQGPLLSSTGSSVLFQRDATLGYDSWAEFSTVALGTDCTILFTYQHQGGGTIFWGSGYWLKYDNATKKFGLYAGANYTLSVYRNLAIGETVKVMVTKANGEARAKFYINGVQLADTGTYSGTTTAMSPNFYTLGYSFGNYALDEVVFFNEVKDATFAAADYNGGDVRTYTAAEAGIVAGWHMDDPMQAKITFAGDTANLRINAGSFYDIDAGDGLTMKSWFGGYVYGCENVYAIDNENVKPYAVATA